MQSLHVLAGFLVVLICERGQDSEVTDEYDYPYLRYDDDSLPPSMELVTVAYQAKDFDHFRECAFRYSSVKEWEKEPNCVASKHV